MGKIRFNLFLVESLKFCNNFGELFFIYIGIADFSSLRYIKPAASTLFLYFVKKAVEFKPVNAHSRRTVHHNKPAVRIQRKTAIRGLFCQPFHRLVGQTEIQNRLHHTGHRNGSAGTDRNQQRIVGITEFFTGGLLKRLQIILNGFLKAFRVFFAVCIIQLTNFRGNCKTCGNGQFCTGHFSQTGAFTAQQLFHFPVAFRITVSEKIHILLFCHYYLPPK